ncbi:NAD(P)-binding protein, partial [Armillaria solidipes]
MPLILNPRLIFSSIPKGHPNTETFTYLEDEYINIETVNLEGGILVEILALSLDPYMRNRMRPVQEPGDMPAFVLNDNVTGFGVGHVLRSEGNGIAAGSHIYRFMPFKKFVIFLTTTAMSLEMSGLGLKVLNNPHKLPWHYFVGALGMTGQTAYYGLKDLSSPTPGETLFVSAACGAVGHLIIQMAKLQKLKVIASCGSDEKVALALRLGADHAFNYRTSHTSEELRRHGPIDIYFDNVGGPTLEAAIENANNHARFVICGMNLWLLSCYRIKIEGMVMTDWANKYEKEFFDTIPQYLASGDIEYIYHEYKGLESTATAFTNMLKGGNTGKTVIILDE